MIKRVAGSALDIGQWLALPLIPEQAGIFSAGVFYAAFSARPFL